MVFATRWIRRENGIPRARTRLLTCLRADLIVLWSTILPLAVELLLQLPNGFLEIRDLLFQLGDALGVWIAWPWDGHRRRHGLRRNERGGWHCCPGNTRDADWHPGVGRDDNPLELGVSGSGSNI